MVDLVVLAELLGRIRIRRAGPGPEPESGPEPGGGFHGLHPVLSALGCVPAL